MNGVVHAPHCFACGNPGEKYEGSTFWKEASLVMYNFEYLIK